MDLMDRFKEKYRVNEGTGCWEWMAAKQHGYGQFYDSDSRKMKGAHRFSYERNVGEIPSDKVLHHECRNKSCVNPDHLRPVTVRQNSFLDDTPARRNFMREKCVHGHELDRIDTKTKKRYCTTCKRNRKRAFDASNRTDICKRGHDMRVTGAERKDGQRYCLVCAIDKCVMMRERRLMKRKF